MNVPADRSFGRVVGQGVVVHGADRENVENAAGSPREKRLRVRQQRTVQLQVCYLVMSYWPLHRIDRGWGTRHSLGRGRRNRFLTGFFFRFVYIQSIVFVRVYRFICGIFTFL